MGNEIILVCRRVNDMFLFSLSSNTVSVDVFFHLAMSIAQAFLFGQ